MYSILKRNLLGVGEFVVVPLHSFGKGLRKIMASDQAPYFFNYTLHKANMMFDLMKVRKSYKLWDFPDTGAVTTKKAVPKDINGGGGVKGGDSNLSKKKNPHKAADGDTKEHPSEDAKSVQEDSSSDVEQPPSTKTS